jgi:hypothetical protein
VPCAARGGGDGLAVEPAGDLVQALAAHSQGIEDPTYDAHLRLAYHQALSSPVVGEAVGWPGTPDQLALLNLLVETPPRPLGDLRPLELGELVEDSVG